MLKTIHYGFISAVYIQMICFERRDDSHIGSEMMERTVVFIGFHHYKVALGGKEQIGVVIIGNTSQKGAAFHVRLMH